MRDKREWQSWQEYRDGATVKLVYENRGEKLGLAHADLNERMAEKIEQADLGPDQAALLDKLLSKDYEVITADGVGRSNVQRREEPFPN